MYIKIRFYVDGKVDAVTFATGTGGTLGGLYTCAYVNGFGKTCIVHTSNFAYLEIHKNHREWYTALKLSRILKGIVVLQFLEFHIHMLFQTDFTSHQI